MGTSAHPRRQRGAVLIVGLVVLLVVSIFGVTAMQTTVLQERMAGNARQNNIALQAAEAGLQAGLTYIEHQTRPPIPDEAGSELVWDACTAGMTVGAAAEQGAEGDGGEQAASACTRLSTIIADWQDNPAGSEQGIAYTDITGITVNDLEGVYAQPRVYIESRYLPSPDFEEAAAGKGTHYYTVTSVGYGQTEKAIAILQSTVAKVYRY